MNKKTKTIIVVAFLAAVGYLFAIFIFLTNFVNTNPFPPTPQETISIPPSEENTSTPSPRPSKPLEPEPEPVTIEPRKDYTQAQKKKKPLRPILPPRLGEEIYGLNPGQLSCTAGAYIEKNDKTFLVTAEHCGEGVFYTSDKKRVGKTSKTFSAEGIQTIRINSSKDEKKLRLKHYETQIPISGVYTAEVGERVCRTGAQSGTICNLIVSQTNVNNVEVENEEETKNNLLELSIEPNYEKYATGLGDSGGIVYRVTPNNEAVLVGILIGGGGEEKKCKVSAGRCFTKTYAYPIADFLRDNNLEIKLTR